MIAIVDYRAGNLTSVRLALAHLGQDCEVTSDASRIRKAERVIFPGVGAAGAAMEHLHDLGLVEVMHDVYKSGKPLLAICIGCQIILGSSVEDGIVSCLGLLEGSTGKFDGTALGDEKVPHMGWNQVHFNYSHPLFKGIPDKSHFYFVHSYYPKPSDTNLILASTQYGSLQFPSVLGKNNLIACQFHPEKSGACGLQLMRNFVDWDGTC